MNRPVLCCALLACAGLLATARPAAAQSAASSVEVSPGAATVRQSARTSATIVRIDAGTRVVTLLRTSDGRSFVMEVPPEVARFDAMAVGDRVDVEYARAVSLKLRKTRAELSLHRFAAMERTPGDKPGGVVARQVTAVAEVVAVDTANRLVTLRGPQGNVVELAVDDPAQLKNVRQGDRVQADYTEALAISVQAPAQ